MNVRYLLLAVLSMVLIGGCANENNLPDWSIGPFERYQSNPILEPVSEGWDSSFVIAPTVIVKDDNFYMIYRGIDKPWDQGGVDAIGLAISEDGKDWHRHPANPIIHSTETYETKGCQDPRIVQYEDTYYLTYTGWHADGYDLCIATSKDLVNWEKHGPIIPSEKHTKSGAIVQNPHNQAVKINGRFVMYVMDSYNTYYRNWIAYSDDLLNWDVKKFSPKLGGESCIAMTDYSGKENDDIVLFYAGGLMGDADHLDHLQWDYSISYKGTKTTYAINQALFSRDDPEQLVDVSKKVTLKTCEPYEGDSWQNCMFAQALTLHKGKWWLLYGGCYPGDLIHLATAPNIFANNDIADDANNLKDKLITKENTQEMKDPIHFRPKTGMGDVLPFYWNGQYHVFYQTAPPAGIKHVSWGHTVSNDLVNWKVLPYAILAGKTYDEPDGHGAYSGSVTEHNGTFHAYYTGHNPHNLQGPEVTLHATSKDLINWTKHPEDMIAPDGIHYRSIKQRPLEQQKEAWPETNPDRERFRDPQVFWNQDEQLWWMVFSARDAKTNAFVQGLATSKDLKTWQQQPPLKDLPASDCPNMFKIDDWWYCIGHNNYYRAKNPRGPYERCGNGVLGTSMIFVPQPMFDGKRHVIGGHLAALHDQKDGTQILNADVMSMLREVYAGADGCLYMRPLKEIVDIYNTMVVDLANKPELDISFGSWSYDNDILTGAPKPPAFWKARSRCSIDVPDNYMLQCSVQLDSEAVLTVGFRQQKDQLQAPYELHIRPRSQEIEIESPGMAFPRDCSLDVSKPIEIQAFIQGSIIECFVNNAHAFTIRAYDYQQGQLSFDVTNGSIKILNLKVKTGSPR